MSASTAARLSRGCSRRPSARAGDGRGSSGPGSRVRLARADERLVFPDNPGGVPAVPVAWSVKRLVRTELAA